MLSFFYNPTPSKLLEKRAKSPRSTAITFFALCNHPTSTSLGLAKDIQNSILCMAQPGAEEDITYHQYKL
ncbi:hypothetical protein [Legionella beliardensis]|nr:hypothetical protein [Legionella beliardensis]